MIEHNDIHIWWAKINSPEFDVAEINSFLSIEEKNRAERFTSDHLRQRFIISHGILRFLLGHYIDNSPSSLVFLNDHKGKPYLKDFGNGSRLCFSLSHSHDMALCGVSWNRQIGVDVEFVRPVLSLESIVQRYFSKPELESMLNTSPEDRNMLFFQYWTMKEAYLKATGEGLTGLRNIQIDYDTQKPPFHIAFMTDSSKNKWATQWISLFPEYSASVSIEGEDARQPIIRKFSNNLSSVLLK
jgi:4'-phosphopantetheinyl transferase